LAPYVQRAAARGFIGVCMANSTPRVAPHGGAAGLHGTNPIAYAVPIEGEEPLLFDAATGHSAARVAAAQEEGQSLPEGVLVNDQGRATVDPQDLDGGALLPVGGALGYGLGLLVDVLCGGLSGGPCGPDVPPVGDLAEPYGCGFFVLAIDPDYFGGREVLAARCAFLVRSARQTRPAAQEERVRVPGDRAREEQHARQIRGIPLARGRWEAVLQRLRACGLAVDDWAWERLA